MAALARLDGARADDGLLEAMRELETASSSAESFAMFVLEKKFWEQVGVERMDGAAFNFRDWYESTLRELPLEMRCAKLLDLANLLATRLHHSHNAAASAQNANQQTKGIAMRSPHQSRRPEKPSFKEIVRVERKLNGRSSTITVSVRAQFPGQDKSPLEVLFERRPSGFLVHIRDISHRPVHSLSSELVSILDRALEQQVINGQRARRTLGLPARTLSDLLQGTLVGRDHAG